MVTFRPTPLVTNHKLARSAQQHIKVVDVCSSTPAPQALHATYSGALAIPKPGIANLKPGIRKEMRGWDAGGSGRGLAGAGVAGREGGIGQLEGWLDKKRSSTNDPNTGGMSSTNNSRRKSRPPGNVESAAVALCGGSLASLHA